VGELLRRGGVEWSMESRVKGAAGPFFQIIYMEQITILHIGKMIILPNYNLVVLCTVKDLLVTVYLHQLFGHVGATHANTVATPEPIVILRTPMALTPIM
jgi:hypothetical protein